MVSPRLQIALAARDAPARVVVYGPQPNTDLSDFADAHVQIVQGFKPAFDHFAARGFDVVVEASGQFDLAIVVMPRFKALAHAMIHDAASRAQTVIVDGQKTDGIDSIIKGLKKHGAQVEVVAKAHGKAVLFSDGAFEDWRNPGALQLVDGFVTRIGVFSHDREDRASQLLLKSLPKKLPTHVADLGAGWGYLSRHILDVDGVERVDVVEADHVAYQCAKENLSDPRAHVHWADATQFTPDTLLDGVIMNPPFHTSRAADPALGQGFIRAAAGMLKPKGQLWLVANTRLPYEATLDEEFAHVTRIAAEGGFKVLHATKPLRTKKIRT